MRVCLDLIKRNVKMFFKDKGLFFTSLVTPLILLVLYATFLSNVYRDSFLSALPSGVQLSDGLVGGLVGGQLFSSLLAVCPITVAFCSNMLMVQDKMSGARRDMLVSPLKQSVLSLSYFLATFLSTLIISVVAVCACLVYLAFTGWYFTFGHIALILLDVLLLTLFGTALSSFINHFLSSQGQVSAVGTIVSSCYGFICGAYMPLSSFAEGLQSVLSFLPFTYGTSLLRNHCLGGVFSEMRNVGLPDGVVDGLMTSLDCKVKFCGLEVGQPMMYVVLVASILIFLGLFIFVGAKAKRASKK